MPQIETDATLEAKSQRPSTSSEEREWDEVLRFWFPDSPGEDLETHGRRSAWRMRGGADEEIVARFTGLTEQAAAGALDHWSDDPRGRLALIVLLDQFSRSVWSGLVAVWCRSIDSVKCSKGDEPWAQSGRMNFARMRCGSH